MRETVGQERLGRATGFSSMALSMGLLLSPVLGGVLYEYAGYFETFVPALVLLGVEVVLRLAIIENRETGSKGDGEVPAGDDDAKRTAAEEQEEANGQEGVVRTNQCSPSALESQPLLPPPPPSPPATSTISSSPPPASSHHSSAPSSSTARPTASTPSSPPTSSPPSPWAPSTSQPSSSPSRSPCSAHPSPASSPTASAQKSSRHPVSRSGRPRSWRWGLCGRGRGSPWC